MQSCSTCSGSGLLTLPGNYRQQCPSCDGTGQQWDPGREFTYVMGPFTLNAAAAAAATNPQYFQNAAIAGPIAQGVTCQVANNPFRWMFGLKVSTFPFAIQMSDAGSGSGRSFVPVATQVHSDLLFGSARNPMPLPTPYVFNPNQNITANFTDLVGAIGFANVTNGSPNVTWNSGALFNTTQAAGPPFPGIPFWNGATIVLGGVSYVISNALGSGVTSQTTLVLATNYLGATSGGGGTAYAVPNNIWVGFKGVELSKSAKG